jgi:hypothetical protein
LYSGLRDQERRGRQRIHRRRPRRDGCLECRSAGDKGEFGKLSKPYSDAKPGKLAYALEYARSRVETLYA